MIEWKRCYCYKCGGESRVSRAAVTHRRHHLLILVTLGLWLPMYLLCCLVREPWRCNTCHKRDYVCDPRTIAELLHGKPGYTVAGLPVNSHNTTEYSGLLNRAFGWMVRD